ncbi:MAG: hypothetical protein ACREIO_08765 [Nitrospiraceae bacterium]
MPLTHLQSGVIAGLLLTTMLVVIGLFVGQSLLKTEREAYERGVRMAAMHAQCRGTLPSAEYVTRAFTWGDPKTCEEVQRIDRSRTGTN